MKLYTLDKITRDSNQDNLYDIFNNQVIPKSYTKVFLYKVTQAESMRIDLISRNVYGTSDYVDEILSLNGIVDPLSIVEGTDLYMYVPDDISTLYTKDDFDSGEKAIEQLSNPSKNTKKDPNREKENQKLPPNVRKSSNIKDVIVGDGVIKISDKL